MPVLPKIGPLSVIPSPKSPSRPGLSRGMFPKPALSRNDLLIESVKLSMEL